MIEIKTQEQFNNINTLIANSSAQGELIRIQDLGDNKAYILSSSIIIRKDNVHIEGYGASKPIIKSNITQITSGAMGMIHAMGTSSVCLEDIQIKNLNLKNNGKSYGIYAECVGKASFAGSTSGTYSRYDSSIIGNSVPHKRGITIKDCVIDTTSALHYGIILSNSDNSIMSNNIISGYIRGIDITGKSNITVNNTCKNNSYGISIYGNNNTISSNIVCNNGTTGIIIHGYNNTVSSNIVQNNTTGIHADNSSSNTTVSSNTVQNNTSIGIYVSYSTNNTICGNTTKNNNGTGITIYRVDCCTISNNMVRSNGEKGIDIDNASTSTGTTLVDNVVQYNNKGIVSTDTCNKILLYGNISSNNTASNYLILGTNNKFEMTYNK